MATSLCRLLSLCLGHAPGLSRPIILIHLARGKLPQSQLNVAGLPRA
jgi:hypothetical protein